MKNMIFGLLFGAVIAAVAFETTGCKSVPTPEGMEATSYAIGVATAKVMNMTDINDKTRNGVIDVLNQVKAVVPKAGQTITDAWSEFAKEYIAAKVAAGEITEIEGQLILKAFEVVVNGIDYLVRIRYPQIAQYGDLTVAAIHGFTDGFLTYFKPANEKAAFCASRTIDIVMDDDAYEYLRAITICK